MMPPTASNAEKDIGFLSNRLWRTRPPCAVRDAFPYVQSRGSVILTTSCKHPACVLVFENLFTAEFVEHTNLQQLTVLCATVVTELKRDVFRHNAAYFCKFVVVAI